MDREMQNKAWGQCEANGGLESLAAEASRRTEKYEAEGDLETQPDAKGERQSEHGKGQKTKIRKAYTITKQRERWTDGEHERFLQALKRYGRAWRKIEEHIGTKTAVQIRSHAQKFFSKLQREQSINGSAGEESSKAGISIPPPRPKRKPAYPYPKKSTGMETDQSCDLETEKEAPSLRTQPSSTPSFMQIPPSLVSPQSKGSLEPSLSQVLESAAAAAACAWSQVVANAGTKVQHQLQAHVAAQQGMHTLLGASQQPLNSSMMYDLQMRQPKTRTHGQHATGSKDLGMQAKNHQAPSQKIRGHHQGPPENSLYGSGRLNVNTAQSAQGSPDDECTVATHNDRDSASSKEPAMEQSLSVGRASTLTPYQSMHPCWAVPGAPAIEARLGRAAWNMMAQAQAQPGIAPFAGHPTQSNSRPSRVTSAGAEMNTWMSSKPQRQGSISRPQPIHARERKAAAPCFQDRSDTSQLAHFYQQAAAEDNGTENGENGSSGAEGGSGSGGGSTTGVKRSAKGSNHDNNCGSDDGQANGSESGANRNGTTSPTEGKGSDHRSGSPAEPTCNSTKAFKSPEDKQLAPSHLQPLMYERGGHVDSNRLISGASSTLRHQHTLSPQGLQDAHQLQMLSQQQLASYQQQALSAWAAATQQPVPSYQLMQRILVSNMQNGSAGSFLADLASHAAAFSKDTPTHTAKKQSSELPSMDAFPGIARSHSIPAFTILQSQGQKSGEEASHQEGESQSGFKPYSKKHGMPISSLPPSKRFAAGTSNDRVPTVSRNIPSLYTPFGNSKVQSAPQRAAGAAAAKA